MSVVLDRPPKTDEELWYLVQALWGHKIPRTSVCTGHDAPFDAFATAYFNREPQILIRGSRGLAGKSRLISLLGLTYAAVRGADVNILGGSLNQSNNIHQTIRDALEYRHAPTYLVKDQSQTMIRLHNGAKLQPLTASQKTVRGPHPPFLLLDEIDEMDPEILESAKGQPMPQKNYMGEVVPAQTVMASTLQYADKAMMQEMKRFEEEGLPIYNWCHMESSNPVDGWLDPDFIIQKKREVSAERWRVEYELGEPSIGNRAFDSEAVERTFSLPVLDEHLVKKAKDWEQYKYGEYSRVREYVIAADWAKAQDFTVITVWDVTELPMKQVYYMRMRRMPYPVMINYYNQLMQKYHAEGIHDATGLGGVVADLLDTRVRNFLMTGANRDDMLSEYVAAVENDKVRAHRVESIYKAHLYASVEDLYSRGKEFHLPDEVCSAALAWKLVSTRAVAVEPSVITNNGDTGWFGRQLENNVERRTTPWATGEVTRRDASDGEFSLMV